MAAAATRAMPRRCWERVSVMWGSLWPEASAEQLAHKMCGIVRDGVATPGDVLIGARKNEFAGTGRLCFVGGDINDRERHAVGMHRVRQGRNHNTGIVAHQRVARPECIIDR